MLVNGQACNAVSIEDRGLLYGDGVFETILCESGNPILFDLHMKRLQLGCERLNLTQQSKDGLLNEVQQVAQQENGVVKIIITRGIRNRGYSYSEQDDTFTRIVSFHSLPSIPIENYQQGIRMRLCDYRLPKNKSLAGIKHLNRLDQIMARNEWQSEYQEGLMLNNDSCVVEGTMTNVFVQSGKEWLTPKLIDSGVSGVMRQWILDNSEQVGMQCAEAELTLQDINNAQALFVCNSVIGIWPVVGFADKKYATSESVFNLLQMINSQLSALYQI